MRRSVADRLLSHSVLDASTGCWIWTGAVIVNRRGDRYGVIKISGKVVLAHRASPEAFRGVRIPKRRQGAHKCDCTLCICPDHIRGATASSNQKESYRKGRKTLSGAALLSSR